MRRSVIIAMAVLNVAFTSVLPGCKGPSKRAAFQVSQQFIPQTTDTYEVATATTKDFKFEQPVLEKARQEETSTTVRMIFDQRIDKVDENGSAEAAITIRDLVCRVVKQNEVQIDYDSRREADRQNPLQKLIGQSYTVRLSPDGKAEALDVSTVKTSNIPGQEGRLAAHLFTKEEVSKRHEIPALPDPGTPVKIGTTWERIVPSPQGMLASKNFRKVYTVKDIQRTENGKIATIEMNASESAASADAAGQGSMGIFAKMLDTEVQYTGKMTMNLDTGKVLDYNETLISSHTAQEMNPKAKPEQGPDTLVIRFIQSIDRKLVQ
ncbi:MAG TPA: hypothetical protein PLX18_02680 [Anaerohalosphaeraceae bacterium]|nr:hypothetical protein [Anaerohalosphaeraceae bacterium]HQG05382.1 hypothetical protein [Anaerohalosphaeraceae bacterium]HQI06755.1 hypothetical protein [Anaerohalosphaeraceae bacterium]HQJ67176.1 hypothetical protein [Anaerohalosphaeraceae bacterium]